MNPIRLSGLLLLALSPSLSAETLVITADRMFDAASERVTGPATIVVEDGLIAAVNPEDHVLKMATIYAADLLGVDDRGIIAEGKRADLVAVPGNALEDIRVMEDVRFVMKLGKVYKGE